MEITRRNLLISGSRLASGLAIGAVAGLWLVLTLSTLGLGIAAGLLLLMTLYGEFRSISDLVDRTPGLSHLDSIGRIQT